MVKGIEEGVCLERVGWRLFGRWGRSGCYRFGIFRGFFFLYSLG